MDSQGQSICSAFKNKPRDKQKNKGISDLALMKKPPNDKMINHKEFRKYLSFVKLDPHLFKLYL
jgi:hypothetical protein